MTGIATEPARCRACGTELAPSLLACPLCRSTVSAEQGADLSVLQGANAAIRTSESSTQRASRGTHTAGSSSPPVLAKSGAIAAALLLLWKAKAILPFLLTKGKLLLVSLPKMGGMLLGLGASLGLYWAAWGWRFALGVIVSIYIHELGHVVAMRRHGIPSSAPMFVPGLGAYVRMHRLPKNEVEHARIGLAGPLAGLGAAVMCAALFFVTGNALYAALAKFGAFINLMNLVPVWHLDGARAFGAFSKRDRWIAIASLVGGAALSGNAFPLIIALICLVRLGAPDPATRDGASLATFAIVVLALSALLTLPVPGFTPG